MSIDMCIDIYRVFCFAPMDCFSLVISKLLKQYLVSHLTDQFKLITAIVTVPGAGERFSQIGILVSLRQKTFNGTWRNIH